MWWHIPGGTMRRSCRVRRLSSRVGAILSPAAPPYSTSCARNGSASVDDRQMSSMCSPKSTRDCSSQSRTVDAGVPGHEPALDRTWPDMAAMRTLVAAFSAFAEARHDEPSRVPPGDGCIGQGRAHRAPPMGAEEVLRPACPIRRQISRRCPPSMRMTTPVMKGLLTRYSRASATFSWLTESPSRRR